MAKSISTARDNREAWIKLLRTTKAGQYRAGGFWNVDKTAFCAFGLFYQFCNDRNTTSMVTVSLGIKKNDADTIVEMNDKLGKSFKEIADFAEKASYA